MRLEDDHPNVYYNFQKGQRVIRRSGQVLVWNTPPWCVLSTDIIIVYVLMGEVLRVDGG